MCLDKIIPFHFPKSVFRCAGVDCHDEILFCLYLNKNWVPISFLFHTVIDSESGSFIDPERVPYHFGQYEPYHSGEGYPHGRDAAR